ncbi:MAG TPA: hypothetical protein V6C76_06525 [Drouetiella sp.]
MSDYIERHDCVAEIITELPGSGNIPQFCFPLSQKYGRYELMVKFSPVNGERDWIGMFDSYGYGHSGIYTLPHVSNLLVIAKGSGYLVDVDSPQKTHIWEPIFPIQGCIVIRDQMLVVLHDYTSILAFDPGGEKWRIKDLVSTDLKVLESSDKLLRGEASLNGRDARFTVMLRQVNMKQSKSIK